MPPGGFAPSFELVVPVTLSDGYQTYGTLIRPDAPVPPCGWPLVVFVHPLGQDRSYDQDLQLLVASQGFAVWTYDVRAHGQAVAANSNHPNAGSTVWGPAELLDLAEHIEFVVSAPAWAGTLDPARIAVTGSSQGGAHAWSVAARSGQLLTAPGRPSRAMPQVACAIAHDLVPDMADDWVRDGVLFGSFFYKLVAGDYAYTGVPLDAGFVQRGRNAFLAQDAAGFVADLAAEGRDHRAALANCTVPLLYTHSYHDFISDPLAGLTALQGADGPHRALFGTGGHGTPANVTERAFRDALTIRWCNRFLWGIPNGVEFEAPVVLAELPLDAAVRDDVTSAWSRTHVADPLLPPAVTRLFLHDDGTLAATEPVPPQVDGTIAQVIDPLAVDFDPAGWLDVPAVRDLTNVLQVCPLAERVYTFVTTAETELAHAARVHLRVVPDGPAWMLAAALTIEPPGGTETMLCSRAIGSRSSVAGVAEDRELLLPPVAVRIPAGATIRLRLRNLWLDEPPLTRQLMAAPLFHDFAVAVVHGDPVAGSWLDLPLMPVRPRLASTTATMDLTTLPPLDLLLRGGTERAGLPYLLVVGLAGQAPGTTYLGETVPINPDWLFGVSIASTWTPFFTGFVGGLDANGDAIGTLDLSTAAPMPVFLTGWCLTAVGFVWDGPWAPTGAPTNALDVQFR